MDFTSADLPQVRRFTVTWAVRIGMSAEAANDFVIAVNEIATNAVRHGSPKASLRLWVTEGAGLAEIRDTGRWPAAIAPTALPRRPAEQGGMGLEVARLVCDGVQIKASAAGTAVLLRMTIRLAPAPASVPVQGQPGRPAAANWRCIVELSCSRHSGGRYHMLSLSSERRGRYTILKVAGNLDLVTRDQFDQFMTRARHENSQVIVDMSAVTFMDTGCLAVIVGHWKKLLSGSGTLILAGAQYRPAKALWITGLAYRLPLYDSVDEAIAGAEAVTPPTGTPTVDRP